MKTQSFEEEDKREEMINEEEFFPRGAVAFLVGVLFLFALIWLFVFAVMLSRADLAVACVKMGL